MATIVASVFLMATVPIGLGVLLFMFAGYVSLHDPEYNPAFVRFVGFLLVMGAVISAVVILVDISSTFGQLQGLLRGLNPSGY